MTWQDEVFVDRLARLEEKHARRRSLFFQNDKAHGRGWAMDIGFAASLLTACLIGFFSVVLARYAIFHSQGLPDGGANPNVVMAVDGFFAFCIAYFSLRMVFSMTSRLHVTAKLVGISLAMMSMHTLVHGYPQIFERAFSPEWVEQTRQATAPDWLHKMSETVRARAS